MLLNLKTDPGAARHDDGPRPAAQAGVPEGCAEADRAERERVAALIERYRAAFARGDMRASAACFRFPYPIVRPELTRVIATPAECAAELGRHSDFYRWCGMVELRTTILGMTGGAGVWLAHVTWTPLDRAGVEINRVDASYVIEAGTQDCRITALIGHNESTRRLPLLRERAKLAQGGRLSPLQALEQRRKP